MTRIIGRPRVLLTAVATALVLAGCGSGPSQATSAAIVGDRSIALDDVQQEIQWLLDNVPEAQQAKQQRKFDIESRKIVQSRVVHQLLTVAAERDGLRADDQQIAELINSSGGREAAARAVRVEPERLDDVAGDQLLLQQLGQKYVDRLSVSLIGTTISSESPGATAEDAALDLGRRISADPGNAASIIQSGGHQVLDERFSLAEALQASPELAVSAVFGADEGDVLVIQPSREQTGWLVALVRERTVSGAAGSGSDAAAQSDPQMLYQVGLRMLQPLADELGVRINPRYGVWDQTAMTVAASEDELTGYQLQPRTVQP
ncbi:SurA N-terminal domain-containing protein [Amycolatopsis marina]|uniref:SurA N-terminal domain-containing protein n=1 Tax=Amycolatopsis marina TaxID=490629 RepID=A0A1I1BAT1_9PSEU|nr:SurA N-terminal domain-containing protein [Amycolatopsis marina]SFB47464.1 SurA N-terminal domain-containing protein [Amycolatopsis marina]